MKEGRIYFVGNPWPEGHPLRLFRWKAEERGGEVWFGFHLETADYYSEREIEHDDDVAYLSDWVAPIVWGNFHSCTISSDRWHDGGFAACPAHRYERKQIDGLKVHVDPLPLSAKTERDELAFQTYLLGHDSVLDHRIEFFQSSDSDLFDIVWEGKIALTYVGDYEPRYRFRAEIKGVGLPVLEPARQ